MALNSLPHFFFFKAKLGQKLNLIMLRHLKKPAILSASYCIEELDYSEFYCTSKFTIMFLSQLGH